MSKFQQTIQLMQKNEEGKYEKQSYKSAEFLPGSVIEDAGDLMDSMSSAEKPDQVKEALRGAYTFIAEVLFEGQFTGEDFRNGIDAREIATLTGKLLGSVTSGMDETYGETKKK